MPAGFIDDAGPLALLIRDELAETRSRDSGRIRPDGLAEAVERFLAPCARYERVKRLTDVL
jgi:hypothetical protein